MRLEHALLVVLTTCLAAAVGLVVVSPGSFVFHLQRIFSSDFDGTATTGVVFGLPVALAYLVYQVVFPSTAPFWKRLLRPAFAATVLAAGCQIVGMLMLGSV